MIDLDIRRVYLPYCVQLLPDGRYIVLNRLYKPIGIAVATWVDYVGHPSACTIKGLTAIRAAKMSHSNSPDLECIYLYADGCVPTDSKAKMAAYSERLAVLSALKIAVG